jgi:hypothetical protein
METQMKRILSFSMAGMLMAGMAIGASAQSAASSSDATQPQPQSLGDLARAQKANKRPDTSKHFDNDTLPHTDKLSVVGQSPDVTADAAATANDGTQPAATQTPAQTSADKQQAASDLKDKIADAQGRVDLLTRELNVAQKEYQLRAAAFYGDAGERLRNASTWDKEDAASKDTLAQKQKELDDAKQALADLQEQARKAGVNSAK